MKSTTIITKPALVVKDGESDRCFPDSPAPMRAVGSEFSEKPMGFPLSSPCPKGPGRRTGVDFPEEHYVGVRLWTLNVRNHLTWLGSRK